MNDKDTEEMQVCETPSLEGDRNLIFGIVERAFTVAGLFYIEEAVEGSTKRYMDAVNSIFTVLVTLTSPDPEGMGVEFGPDSVFGVNDMERGQLLKELVRSELVSKDGEGLYRVTEKLIQMIPPMPQGH